MKTKFLVLLFVCLGIACRGVQAQNYMGNVKELIRLYSSLHKPIVMAHRMSPLMKGYAENSMETLEYNMKHYPDAIQEIDVRITADGKAVLLHDETLDRTTTGKGRPDAYTYRELNRLELKDACGNVLKGQRIPLLKDVLLKAKGKVAVMLDMKPGTDPDIMMDIVKQTGMLHEVVVICYSVNDGVNMHRKYPELLIALGFNSRGDILKIKKSGIPTDRLIALVPKVVQEQSYYDCINEMKVPISFSAQGRMDLMPDAVGEYRKIYDSGISILCTDSIAKAYAAFGD